MGILERATDGVDDIALEDARQLRDGSTESIEPYGARPRDRKQEKTRGQMREWGGREVVAMVVTATRPKGKGSWGCSRQECCLFGPQLSVSQTVYQQMAQGERYTEGNPHQVRCIREELRYSRRRLGYHQY